VTSPIAGSVLPIKRAEELILTLPGVISARIIAGDSGAIDQIHVLTTSELTPKQMLALGVFGGKYMTDCSAEFPVNWFERARLCPSRHDPQLNCFGINASQPLSLWRAKGWIYDEDPRGWFQWYCRYFLGRRCPDDQRQIRRWRAIRRHVAQLQQNCARYDMSCRRRQRQALLHWAYDARNL
jgi:hypothetical protein